MDLLSLGLNNSFKPNITSPITPNYGYKNITLKIVQKKKKFAFKYSFK